MNLRKLKLISPSVIVLIFCEFLYNSMLTSLPLLTNLLIESIIENKFNSMILFLIIESALVVVSAILYLVSNILSKKVSYEIEHKLKKAFLNNRKDDPIDKFSKSAFKNSYLYNSQKLVTNYYFKKIDIFIFTFAIIFSFVFTTLISWQIALIATSLNMIIIVVTIILKNKNAKVQKDYANNRETFIKESSKIFNGLSDLHAFNRIKVMDSFLGKINKSYYKRNKLVNKRDILYSSVINIASIIVASAITLITIFMSKAGIIGLYVVISLIAANTTMNAYMKIVFSDVGDFQSMSKLMSDVNIRYKKEEDQNKELFPIRIDSLHLKTRNKTLEYKNICIEKNNKYFLKGKNGAGKSILLSAIQGIFKLEKGNIKYNNYNRGDLNIPTISAKMINLKHEPLIFKGTILENLFISHEEWNKVTKEFSFIAQNFKNCNADANSLSLGEKQMIALLRALLLNKELIIIDEGLAAISKNNREKIENYLDSLNKTIIYVSHVDTSVLKWKPITIA